MLKWRAFCSNWILLVPWPGLYRTILPNKTTFNIVRKFRQLPPTEFILIRSLKWLPTGFPTRMKRHHEKTSVHHHYRTVISLPFSAPTSIQYILIKPITSIQYPLYSIEPPDQHSRSMPAYRLAEPAGRSSLAGSINSYFTLNDRTFDGPRTSARIICELSFWTNDPGNRRMTFQDLFILPRFRAALSSEGWNPNYFCQPPELCFSRKRIKQLHHTYVRTYLHNELWSA